VDCFGESCLARAEETGSDLNEPPSGFDPDDTLEPDDAPPRPSERPPTREELPVDAPIDRPVPTPSKPTSERFCVPGGSVAGSLTIRDQEALAALESCAVINGSLEIIGAFADLAPLRSLQRITGTLTISMVGALNGLESLESVGALVLDSFNLPTLQPLSGTRQVAGSALVIARGRGLRDLSGLENVVSASIQIVENTDLESLTGLFVPEELQDVLIVSNPALRSIDALAPLARAKLLDIEGAAIDDLTGLSGLLTVETLVLVDDVNLVDTSQLAQLQSVNVLYLDNVALTTFVAPALVTLTSAVIQNNPRLVEVDSLSAVIGLSELSVLNNPSLERLPTFPAVAEMEQVYVRNNARLAAGPAFPNASHAQTVLIQENPSLTQLLGLANVQTTRTIDIAQNASLTELDLGALASARELRIMCNPLLEETTLEPLRTLQAQVQISGNLGSATACVPEPLE
jgi:hypothetical protein